VGLWLGEEKGAEENRWDSGWERTRMLRRIGGTMVGRGTGC
jgi:hypothetical protein